MSIVDSDGPPSWSLDASETGESTKCPWVGVGEGKAGEKNRETVTASLCLVYGGLSLSLEICQRFYEKTFQLNRFFNKT